MTTFVRARHIGEEQLWKTLNSRIVIFYLNFRFIFVILDKSITFAVIKAMRVIAKKTLVLFYTKHEDAETALGEWYEKTENADWENFAQLKQTFNSADSVGNQRYVFNIKGNHYRLVALVLFRIKMVYIRFIGTHKEYDQIKDIANI